MHKKCKVLLVTLKMDGKCINTRQKPENHPLPLCWTTILYLSWGLFKKFKKFALPDEVEGWRQTW